MATCNLRRNLVIWLVLTCFVLVFSGMAGTVFALVQPEVVENCCDSPLPCPEPTSSNCDENFCPCTSVLHFLQPDELSLRFTLSARDALYPDTETSLLSRCGDPIDYPPESV